MTKVEVQVEQWQEHGIQVMVLLSFAMQLVLLVLAEFRRRIDSGVLRAVIWSAYMLADSIAIYILGHLSVTSRSEDHELMAFWAPFLLLHLGGQDNITAYAIEDNRLWLRHLQTLVVQVAAATYILYESIVVSNHTLLRNAAVLMFVLGVIKYGERVWAIKCADTRASGSSYKFYETGEFIKTKPPIERRDTEGLLQIAHLLLDVPKDLFQGPLTNVMVIHKDVIIPTNELYKVVEMQLSLMHDVVYSKAGVIHTWYGICIRFISPVFATATFILFHRSALSMGDPHYSRADVAITYVLLGGAVTLEIVSVLRVVFSRWLSVILGKSAYDFMGKERPMWGFLARAVTSARRFLLPERNWSRWWWSCSMGQHNLLNLCVGSRASRRSRIAGWMGLEDRWNTMVYSRSIPVSTTIKELVLKQVQGSSPGKSTGRSPAKLTDEKPDNIINSQGRAALKKWGSYDRLGKFVYMELDESILVWHIATDIYLRWYKDQRQAAEDDVCQLAKATEAISNYMVFLLAARPYMLPDSVGRTRYVNVCFGLTALKYKTIYDLTSLLTSPHEDGYIGLQNIKNNHGIGIGRFFKDNTTVKAAQELARELISPKSGIPTELGMLAEVWVEMICYAGYRCSGYSHAKQLSNGGELLTVVALVVEYYRRGILKPLSSAKKEEEEGRPAVNHDVAGNLKATIEIVLQPTSIEPMSPSPSRSPEEPLGEPRSLSYESKDEISPV